MAATLTDAASSLAIPFNEDITILTDQPRPALRRGNVQVFSARGEGRAPSNLLAYICDPQLTPRLLKAPNQTSISNPHLMSLISSGSVQWGSDKQRKFCFIYEDTIGLPLVNGLEKTALGIKPESLMSGLIKPMVGVLYDLQNTEMGHGAIRPQNMYGQFTATGVDKFVLGECLTLPPGYDQPVLYETIARGMTNPAARGSGTIKDDLYSFGVTLAVLMRNHDSMAGFSDDEIIRAKVSQSSFTALFGKENLNGSHVDLIRGLLQDDDGLRWTISDIEGWLESRRQTPKTGARKRKAGRPLTINNEKYIYPELVAYDIYKHPSESARLIDNGEFGQWISRSLEDKDTETRLDRLKEYIEDGGQKEMREKRLLTCMSMALHPEAPLRYESLAIMPQGFGTAFSETVMKKGNIRPYLDIIQMRTVVNWLEVQEIGTVDISAIFSRFDACRNYLSQAPSGFGFERCLYEMDVECACLSDKIAFYDARDPEGVLFAFEEISKQNMNPVRLFDRHVTAFLMTRDRKNIEPYLHDLNSTNEQKRLLGELLTLATIQKRTRSAAVPHLAKWFNSQRDIFLSRIHDRQERDRISISMDKIADSGDLSRLLTLLDNPQMKMADATNFRRAMQEYHGLERESNALERELMNNPNFGRGMGRNVAAGLSAVIAFAIICITMVVYLSGKGEGMPF